MCMERKCPALLSKGGEFSNAGDDVRCDWDVEEKTKDGTLYFSLCRIRMMVAFGRVLVGTVFRMSFSFIALGCGLR